MNRAVLLISICVLAACSSVPDEPSADNIAVGFGREEIAASPFILTSYNKILSAGAAANVYIEGDGRAWIRRNRPSRDPTPKNPVALKLATQDDTPNVFYLARPCQYSKMISGECSRKYWTSHRFAPEVIESMDMALNDIKSRYHINGFHLIGFSGGANVSALLAARRSDVLSLRTVAGNLDHALLHKMHSVSQIPSSLNAKDIAHTISHIPQHHFIGEDDKIINSAITQSFIESAGDSQCIRKTMVPNTTHQGGWLENWKVLLARPVNCR